MRISLRWATLLVAIAISSAAQAGVISYNIVDLGTLGSSAGATSFGISVNNFGQVVGQSTIGTTTPGAPHAFMWSDGAIHDLGVLPGGGQSSGRGINDLGQVTGYSTVSGGSQRAFLYANGVMTNLGAEPNAASSVGEDINNAGVVTGFNQFSGNRLVAFSNDGSFTDLDVLGTGTASHAYAISNSGYMAGWSNTVAFGQDQAVLWNPDGTAVNLHIGGVTSIAYGVNDDGDVTGRYLTSDDVAHAFFWNRTTGTYQTLGLLPGEAHGYGYSVSDLDQVVGAMDHANPLTGSAISNAFIWQNGVTTALDSLIDPNLGWNLIQAQDISSNGNFITGFGIIGGKTHAFLLCALGEACNGQASAVPEPAAWSMLTLGFGLLGGAIRQRGRSPSPTRTSMAARPPRGH